MVYCLRYFLSNIYIIDSFQSENPPWWRKVFLFGRRIWFVTTALIFDIFVVDGNASCWSDLMGMLDVIGAYFPHGLCSVFCIVDLKLRECLL